MRIPDFLLERFFARHEFEAPYLLCASDVEGYALTDLLALAGDEERGMWESLVLGYTESRGHPALRAEVASLYTGVSADDVLVFAGAQEAIFTFVNVAMGSGDHALVVWPAYQSLFEVARAAGASVSLLRLDPDRAWMLDVDEVRSAARADTRAIVVNFPHNPTGTMVDERGFRALAVIAEEAGCYLFSDEVYRFLEYDESERLPAAVEISEKGVSLGVMSKSFALAGLRIGWIACRDRALLDRLAAFKDYLTICSSGPSEILALIALRARADVLQRSRSLVTGNLALVDELFARAGGRFKWVRPRAGAIGFPRLEAEIGIEEFGSELLASEGVLLLPGSAYGYPGNHFRIGFGRTNAPEALERLERFVRSRLGPV